MLLSSLLSACAPSPVDELSRASTGELDLVLGWIDPPEAGMVEIALNPDDGEALTWRQEVGAAGRGVGTVSFDRSVRVELRRPAARPWEDPLPLGPALVLDATGEGVAEVGATRLYWQVGKDLPPPNPKVDERPGPPDGWLQPKTEAAPPLVVGMAESAAEGAWEISGRALAGPERATRGLGGLTAAEGGGIRARGLVTVEDHEIVSISFLISKTECDAAVAGLEALYGAPTHSSAISGPTWLGGRHQVHVLRAGGCSVSFARRAYGEKTTPKPAAAAPPNAAVDAHPGPPDGWVSPAKADVTPLGIGQPEERVLQDWKLRQVGRLYELGGIDLDPQAQGNVRFKEGLLAEILILRPDPGCAATRAALTERYGPMSGEDPHLGAEWKGETARASAMDSGEKSCLAQWKRR